MIDGLALLMHVQNDDECCEFEPVHRNGRTKRCWENGNVQRLSESDWQKIRGIQLFERRSMLCVDHIFQSNICNHAGEAYALYRSIKSFTIFFLSVIQGLIQSGAWGIFNEFDRIELQVLSVVAQQVTTIQRAIATKTVKLSFDEQTMKLDPSCNIMLTLCSEYAAGKRSI